MADQAFKSKSDSRLNYPSVHYLPSVLNDSLRLYKLTARGPVPALQAQKLDIVCIPELTRISSHTSP